MSAPVLRVVRGDATPEEIAALVAVLTSVSGTAVPPTPAVRPLWGRPQLREGLSPGPSAWRASGLPR